MTLSEAEKYGSDLFQKIGVKDLKEARAMDAAELMRRLDSVSPEGAMFGLPFGTCIDGKFVKEPVELSYYNDRLPDVPMIVGVCMGETQGMFGRGELTYEELLREEDMVSEKSKGKERGARQIGKEKAKVQEHQKEGMRNEMG